MEMVDFDAFKFMETGGYRGNAGRKIAVEDYRGGRWMLKFPQSTKNFEGRNKPNHHLPSYTTSPISEYIGSKIYSLLGIPAHEVVLGRRSGKIVVGCKDFTDGGAHTLREFHEIKNTVEEDVLEYGNSSSRGGEYLSEALMVIDKAALFDGMRDTVRERFWDMFVVDAFILNNDRNNGNWGVLIKSWSKELAPVYDNGNAFFNKMNDSLAARKVSEKAMINGDVNAARSFFLDGDGKKIAPFRYMSEEHDAACEAAVLRFAERLDMARIFGMIDEIPEQAFGLRVISPEQRAFYKEVLIATAHERILPTAQKIRERLSLDSPSPETSECVKRGREQSGIDLDAEAKDAREASHGLDGGIRVQEAPDR